MSMIFQYMPNQKTYHYTTSGTTWVVLGVLSGTLTGYATWAALLAAGATPFPALDAGMFVQSLVLKCENASAADGSAFYFSTNSSTTATDDTAQFVSGSGQGFAVPGPISALWLRKTTAGDEITITIYY